MKLALVILAGGSGQRFGGPIPKQFQNILGKPVIAHSVEPFLVALSGQLERIFLVVPEQYVLMTEEIVKEYFPDKEIGVIVGGNTRIKSYFNAIRHIKTFAPEITTIMTHDAARPAVNMSVIEQSLQHFIDSFSDAHLTVQLIKESLFEITALNAIQPRKRDTFRLGQTPYIFSSELLYKTFEAYKDKEAIFYDSIDIFELFPNEVRIGYLETAIANIKLTHVDDLKVVEQQLAERGKL